MEFGFQKLGKELSNWGRWGADDERGTTNFITPACLARAASLVRVGKAFGLGLPLDEDGPQVGSHGRINPVHMVTGTGRDGTSYPGGGVGADDYVFMPLQAATHWDGLAHWYYEDQLYNGFSSMEVTSRGALKDGIEKQSPGIAGRGVLVDVAALKGVEMLEDEYVVTPDDLDAALARQGVEIGSGDILMLRTGHIRVFLEQGAEPYTRSREPGLGVDCCRWLHEREIAAVCADNHGVEVLPGENADEFLPVHSVLIRDMGMTLGESWNFEELAADCTADGQWDMLVTAPVLRVTRGLGAPLNPLAFK